MASRPPSCSKGLRGKFTDELPAGRRLGQLFFGVTDTREKVLGSTEPSDRWAPIVGRWFGKPRLALDARHSGQHW
jgi:hypothetical protein